MLPSYFAHYPEPPTTVTAGAAIARMIDGLGFRLHVALNGLNEADCAYRICEDGKSIHEIIAHIFDLVNWVHKHVEKQPLDRPDPILEQGIEALRALEQLRQHFAGMSDDALASLSLDHRPFWSIINMPLSDATHHAGQICAMRRGAGNPCGWPRSR